MSNLHTKMKNDFRASFVILLSSITLCTALNKGLLFNRFTGSLYDVPDKISPTTPCGPWATACPAESPAEIDFVRKFSVTNNPLFVKKIWDERAGETVSQLGKYSCNKPYSISLAYNVRSLSFEFGFEIYHSQGEFEYFQEYDYGDYKSLKKLMESTQTLTKKLLFAASELKRVIKQEKKDLWLGGNIKVNFIWIYMFKLKFSLSKKVPTKVTYEIRENNRWPVAEKCSDYSLGEEVYEEISIDQLYSKENQTKIFQNLKLPSEPSQGGCDTNAQCSIEGNCESSYECLEKWLLVPIDQFHFGSSSSPLCSNLTTVPIWKSTVKFLLQKLDRFLYAIHLAAGDGLHIISGTKDELQIPKKKSGKETIYLYREKKKTLIAPPNIIFKIVKYQLKNCKAEICQFAAVVIIHNDPYFDGKTLCAATDKDWGWSEITYDAFHNRSKFLYVCQYDKTLWKKLLGFSLFKDPPTGNLDLTEFPYIDENGMVDKKKIDDEVLKRFDELSRSGGNVSYPNDRIIERPLAKSKLEDEDNDEEEFKNTENINGSGNSSS